MPKKKIVEQEDGNVQVVLTQITPYEDEPLAEVDDNRETAENQEADEDGLTAAVLEARYEREIAVYSWLV